MDMAKPKIRFKGYTDEWEQRKLGDFTWDAGKRNKEDLELEPYAITNEHGFIRQRDAHDDFGYMKDTDRKAYNIVQPNSFAYNPARINVGSIGYYKGVENVIVSSLYEVFQTDNYVNDRFLWHWLKSDEFPRWIEKLQEGSVRLYFYYDKLCECQLYMPSLEEQEKIASFVDGLDHLITLHQRKAICTKNVRNNHILSIFLWERAVFMGKMILYHGSPNEMIHPIYGLGEDKHDYGRGFYLTANIELAKEWAVCRPDQSNGWVHKYELETDDLRILDFQQLNVLSWLAELMKHREASDSKRYRMLAAKFIEKYGIDTDGYDVIKGWRADASYFYIAKAFVRDEIDVDILEELLFLGDLGIQYCIKSEKGYANLHELESELLPVSFADFNDKYNERDIAARENMRKLIDSDANKVTKVFSTLI